MDKKQELKAANFVKIANKEGFVDTMTRKDIKLLMKKYDLSYPAWLMKNEKYQIRTGKFLKYRLPSSNERDDEFKIAYQKLKDEQKNLDVLNAKEHQVLSLRFGLADGVKKTLNEVGQIMDLTKQRIFQLEQRAFKKLEVHTGVKMKSNLTSNSRNKY